MKENIKKKGAEEEPNNQLSNGVTLGDVIWVKIKGCSWWPAQVFDVDSVSARCKPREKADGEVLVRLYGSYKYLYVDHVTAQSEFAPILEENNGKYHEILLETLNKDLSCLKSGKSKRQRVETKESANPNLSNKTPPTKRKQGMKKKPEANEPESAPSTGENSQDQPSSRKLRVMQSLGLIAPPGSPFQPKYMNSSPGKKVEHD